MKHAFKKTLAMLLVLAMVIGVIPSVFAAKVAPFTDVDDSDWFAPFVKYVYEHDPQLMNGTSATTFDPEGTCTRAMAAVVLYRLADPVIPSVKPSTFIDLKEDWYKNGIAWAQQKGIVNGVGDNRFDPDGLVTREQLVTMLWRYAGSPKVEGDFLKGFPDANQIADYAKEAFNWAISMKIIAGSDGKLLPQDNATRAQFAKIISVFDEATKPCEEHTWDEGKVTKEPTCTEEGEIVYTCERCGETKTETLPATGHNYVNGVCTGCGDKLAEKDEIVIYYTNDVHTYIDGALSYDNIADLKAQTASVAAGVLLLDAGDHVQGTAYGSMDKGKTIIELMNAADYDAATLGNHEFDYGMDRALELIEMADYPYLSANFYHEKDGVPGESVLDSYKIFEVGGKKIAVVGITTPESFTKSTPKYFQDEAGNYIYGIAGGADGTELYNYVQTAVDLAKRAGADYVIALGHCGDDPASKPWTSEEVIANTTGIDAFIDGHSHSTNPMTEVKAKDGKTVVLTQTGSYFGAIGRMSITKDGIKSELIEAYNGSDKDVAAIKNAWIAEIDTKLGEVIGHTALTFDNYDKDGNRLVRKQETNTGDFAADALYYLFDNMDLDVDLAIMNGGGVRNKAITGDISYKTCKSIHTFGNVACLITVTGQQILDALEWGARDVGTAECGGFLQVSGVSYEIHSYIPSTVQKDDKGVWTAGPTGEYRVKNVKIGGEPLDLTKTYNMAGYNYTLRDCGDGFAMFKGAVNVLDYVMEDYMVLANYVKSFPEKDGKHEIEAQNSVLDANYAEVTGEGRITVVPTKGESKEEYVLTSTLKDGDKVVIYNPGYEKTLSATVIANYYLAGSDVKPANGKYVDPAADIVWEVKAVEGGFELSNGGNKISMGNGTYHSIPMNDVNTTWAISPATTEGCVYITNTVRNEMLEWYADKTEFSAIGYRETNESMFAMQLYVLGATATDPTPDPEPTPEGYVAIYNPAEGKVMTTEVSVYNNKDQLKSADATLSGDKLTTEATNVALFKMETVDGITTFTTEDGKYLYADGTHVRIVEEAGENTEFVLEEVEGGSYIKCKNAVYTNTSTGETKAQYIEFYSNVFTVYGMGSDASKYTFGFYELDNGATPDPEPTPDPDPTPDPAPEGYVAIYNPAEGKVMTTEVSVYNNKDQLKSADATLSGDKLTTEATNVALFKMETVDGTTTFKTEDGKYLYADGTHVRIVEEAGENTEFVLEEVEGGSYIKCKNAVYTNTSNGETKAQYIEFHYSVFTVYGMGSDASKYTFGFYELNNGATPNPNPNPNPDTKPGDEYVLTSELKEGDEVVIVCAAKNMALSSTYSNNYNNGVAVTPTEGKITDPAADIVWVVGKEGDFYTFSFEGKKIAMGTEYTSMPLDGVNYKWQLQDAATEGAFYLANLDREVGKEYRMQWREEKSYWSAYHTIAEGAEELFALNFYVKGAEAPCAHEWWEEGEVTTEATCTTAGVMTFGCEKCDATKTEEIPPLGHIDENNDDKCDRCQANLAAGDYSIAESVAIGDKIILVIEYDGKFYAAANDNKTVNNALNAIEVNVTSEGLVIPYGADLLWEVCAGSAEGTFTLKSSDGKYIYYPEKTNVSLADEGSDLTITCGDGTSKILLTSTAEAQTVRNLFFRMNKGVPQFRFYGTVNATASGYSSVLTIWKAN